MSQRQDTTGTIELHNDFHATRARLRPHRDQRGNLYLSARQVARARRALCGLRDCSCGGDLGERGPQPVELLSQRQDGGYDIEVIQ